MGSSERPRCEVLPVEDDVRLARTLALALADAGDDVRVAEAAAQVRVLLRGCEPEVIVLYLDLPDGDGGRPCADARSPSAVPILIVSAPSDSADVVAGLETSLDDDAPEPVVGSELPARIRAVLRRAAGDEPAPSLSVGPLVVDLRHGFLTRDAVDVSLTRTERGLLRELALHAGQVVTRAELLERVWGYQDIGDTRLLDVHVRRLRTKLERDPSTPEFVLTVRGLGYRFAALSSGGGPVALDAPASAS